SAPSSAPGSRQSTASAVPLGELKGHKGAVGAVAFTDDGRSIVTTGDDRTLRIWSASTGGLSRTIALDGGPATSMAIIGTRALTGHSDGRTLLWDLDRGDKPSVFKRNEADVWSVTFAGEPNRFAVSTHDWKVALWDAGTTSAPLHVFDGHESAAQAVAFSRHRRLLASGSADKTVKLWNLETLDLERTYRGHSDFVTALAFSPDGKTLASASLDGSIRLWSTSSNRLVRKLTGHKGRVGSLAFAPSGDTLASAGDDGTVRIWDHKRGRTSRTFIGHAGAVKAVAYAPDGKRIAAAGDDGIVRIWPAVTLLPRRDD
ncbi:MAG: WD40 repeat domain-containing protein, partial [Hyphomicrobium sp.]